MTVVEICFAIIIILMNVIGFLVREKVKNIETELTEVRNNLYEFKENYLDRFEKVNKNITETKIEIIEKLHAIDLKIK